MYLITNLLPLQSPGWSMVRASGSPFVGEGGAQAIPLYLLLLYMHTYVIVTINPT